MTASTTTVPAEAAPLVSIIIASYNYAEYVGETINSALALDWPNKEVIVVDDGSTDNSRAVIESYGDRIKTIFQQNAGQLAATNAAFAMSRGEIVYFLDSDDLCQPSLLREVMALWTPDTSKVQVQMQNIDGKGRSLGTRVPHYNGTPTAAQIRKWSATAGAYPTPCGSGNVYSRRYLERIFPLKNTCGHSPDSYCIPAAPYLGEVHTLPKPLVSYRVHGRNAGAMATLVVSRFADEVIRARQRRAFAAEAAAKVGLHIEQRALNRSLYFVSNRIASRKLAPPSHPIENDSIARLLVHLCIAFFTPQGVTLRSRLTMLVWGWAVCLSPQALARELVLWRFAPSARPPGLRTMLSRLGVVRA